MQVKVKYFNVLQEALGKKEEVYHLDEDIELAALIRKIADNDDRAKQMLYQDSDTLASHIRLFVNDKMVYDLSTPLTDGAEVAIFYAVVGG